MREREREGICVFYLAGRQCKKAGIPTIEKTYLCIIADRAVREGEGRGRERGEGRRSTRALR